MASNANGSKRAGEMPRAPTLGYLAHRPMQFDVAIVGAGTAGAGVAWQCAKRGMRVICLDTRPLGEAGARWINGVPSWQLDDAGIPRPSGAELLADDPPLHLVAGWGPERVVLTGRGVVELDMRELVARLQSLASEAGATLRGGVRVLGLSGDRLETSEGPLRAEVTVDASGLAGTPLAPRPVIAREHLCAAAQAVHTITDHAAARDWFAQHEVPEGDALCFTGIAGGYSIINVRLEGDTLGILTGSIPADGHPSGRALLDRFVAEHSWIGSPLFGGARAIPIRRPFDRLVHGRVALLGDAASQVFSAHGSGIGIGLLAGRVLAESLANENNLANYERRFLREHGGLLAGYDIFRRFSQRLAVDDLARLMRIGVLDARSALAGTSQRWPTLFDHPTTLNAAALASKLEGFARAPAHTVALARVGARMAEVAALYRVYPGADAGWPAKVWSRAVARIVGDPEPDL
jgi:flavin-dependent dehydrogenase